MLQKKSFKIKITTNQLYLFIQFKDTIAIFYYKLSNI